MIAVVQGSVLITGGLLIALVLVLAFLLLRHDPSVGRTRIGFFIERQKFDDEPDDDWPEPVAARHTALPHWPDRETTAELPPEKPQ